MAGFNRNSSREGREGRDNRREGGFGGQDAKKTFFKRKRSCPLSGKGAPKIDYKDIRLLGKFVSERGKIMPRRISAVCAKKQRELAEAIKRARTLALLPYSDQK